MSEATRAKTARERATIAAKMIKGKKPGCDFRRNFDDCFEMGDGEEVWRRLMLRAAIDDSLLAAMRANGMPTWVERVESIRKVLDAPK